MQSWRILLLFMLAFPGPVLAEQAYTDPEHGFSLVIADGWTVQNAPDSALDLGKGSGTRFLVQVGSARDLPALTTGIRNLVSEHGGKIEQEGSAPSAGVPGHMLVYSKSGSFGCLAVFVGADRSYLVMSETDRTNDTTGQEMASMLNSFRVEPGNGPSEPARPPIPEPTSRPSEPPAQVDSF